MIKKIIAAFTVQILIISNSAFAAIGKTESGCFSRITTTLSPCVQLSDSYLQSSFLLAQKKAVAANLESFVNILSVYSRESRPELPIILEIDSVLFKSLLNDSGFAADTVMPGSPESLTKLRKLIQREKIILCYSGTHYGRTVFKIVPFDSDISSDEIARTGELAAIWEREIKKFIPRDDGQTKDRDGGVSLLTQFAGLTPGAFKTICLIIKLYYDYPHLSFNSFQKYYLPFQIKFGLPSLPDVIDAIGEQENLDKLVEDFYAAKTKTAVEEARASCAVENFRALSQTAGFQNYLAEMIQNYYTQAGAENGRIFLTLSESVAMKQNSFISASFPSHASQAIASIHTHYAGLAGIAPLFFLPSAVDIQAGVCAENQNNAILWGDVKLGFYLTVLDDQDSKLNEIIYERLRNEALGKPVDDFPLERYRQNTHNYKYYKLIPQGNRLRKGIAFSYALEEVPYPDEALAEIMQSLPEVNQRIWSVWKDEQKWTMLEESSGDNQLEFLKAERERILGAGLTEEAIQNPYPEHLKDLFDSELRSFMLERETKARKLRIEILDRLIEKQVPRPESGSNAYLPEQSI